MAIVRWEPFRELMDLRRSMDHLFEDYAYPFRHLVGHQAVIPLDIYHTDNAMVVKGSLPGVKPEDVDITITGDTLTIRGESKEDKEVKRDDYLCREHYYGTLSRTVTLPDGLDIDKAEASFEDGVLTLTIPKSEEQKPKQIKIKAKAAIDPAKKRGK